MTYNLFPQVMDLFFCDVISNEGHGRVSVVFIPFAFALRVEEHKSELEWGLKVVHL